MNTCAICQRIEDIKNNKNSFFVKELHTGYVVLGDHQYYKGYTIFISKIHARELHELESSLREEFLKEMSLVAEAVYTCFKPIKLNYELLGNTDEHLHWHLFPRYEDDKNKKLPIWITPQAIRNAPETIPSDADLQQLRTMLKDAIDALLIKQKED